MNSTKTTLTVLGSIVLAVVLYFGWACYWPLDNDAEVIEAQRESHYSGYGLCGETCHLCHPYTWRLNIRRNRKDIPF